MDYRFRSPTRRPQDNGAPPPRYRLDTTDGMIIERDVAVPVRGGVTVYADVFRPGDERPAPPLIAWSPYGKHAGSQVTERYPDGGVAPGQLSGLRRLRVTRPAALDGPGLRGRQRRHPRVLALARQRHLPVAGGSRVRPRLHRVGRGAAVEQREGRHVRRLVPDLGAVVDRRHQPAAPGRHQPVGRLERHLPGGGPSRRHPGDLLLALHRPAVGLRDAPGGGSGGRNRRASALRRLLGQQGGGSAADHRARLRRGQLVRPGPAHPGHLRGVQEDQLAAQMARRPRRQEVGLLLRTREPAAPAGVLRPLPQGRRHRGERVAGGELRGP